MPGTPSLQFAASLRLQAMGVMWKALGAACHQVRRANYEAPAACHLPHANICLRIQAPTVRNLEGKPKHTSAVIAAAITSHHLHTSSITDTYLFSGLV